MPLNTQTKQTLASMSWARLTWQDRVRENPYISVKIYAGNINSIRYTYNQYQFTPCSIVCTTLSQMEVVSWTIEQFDCKSHFRHGQFYITKKNTFNYLHSDGIIRYDTINHETNQATGWFLTKEEAQQVLDEYNAKQQTNILRTPTNR